MRGGAPPGLNEYRILHRDLVKTASRASRSASRARGARPYLGPADPGARQDDPDRHQPAVPPDEPLRRPVQRLQGRARRVARPRPRDQRPRAHVPGAPRSRREDPRQAARPERQDRQGRPAAPIGLDELIKEAEDHGAINQGFIGRDLAEVLDRQGKEAAQRLGQGKVARHTRAGQKVATSRVGSKVAHPIDTIRDLSQYREDASGSRSTSAGAGRATRRRRPRASRTGTCSTTAT
jgi:hypothetical protein